MVGNLIQNGPVSYKNLLNQRIDEKFARTTRRLALELDILRRRDLDLELSRILSGAPSKTAAPAQEDFIAQSIKKILDIRKRLGIEAPAGAGKPLNELLTAPKGAILDKTL